MIINLSKFDILWVNFFLLVVILFAFSAGLAYSGSPKIIAVSTLDEGELHHLVFMREEEKLARDVYLTLGGLYPGLKPFAKIDGSEQRHTDTVKNRLEQYSIPDPNTDDRVGYFTGEYYGGYFLEKYELLTSWGSESSIDALYVGAFIEELDMKDIVHCPDVIVDMDNGIDEGDCGLLYTDEHSLIESYTNLLEGSKDHLRAFVRSIEKVIGEGNYLAQVLSQKEVDEILGR